MEQATIPEESARYNSMSGARYETPHCPTSFATCEVLPLLKGRPWDNYALAWVHGLRPSRIRVIDGAEHCDAWLWRVTVYIDPETRLITEITQEIEIACLGDIENGHDLCLKTQGG